MAALFEISLKVERRRSVALERHIRLWIERHFAWAATSTTRSPDRAHLFFNVSVVTNSYQRIVSEEFATSPAIRSRSLYRR
jgi:hypothetical protein